MNGVSKKAFLPFLLPERTQKLLGENKNRIVQLESNSYCQREHCGNRAYALTSTPQFRPKQDKWQLLIAFTISSHMCNCKILFKHPKILLVLFQVFCEEQFAHTTSDWFQKIKFYRLYQVLFYPFKSDRLRVLNHLTDRSTRVKPGLLCRCVYQSIFRMKNHSWAKTKPRSQKS